MFLRDAHFVIGEEDEKKTEEDDNLVSDPKYVTFTCCFSLLLCSTYLFFLSDFVRVFFLTLSYWKVLILYSRGLSLNKQIILGRAILLSRES